MTCVYSPRKNIANFIALYSVWISADELLLALRQVERQPVRLGQRGVKKIRHASGCVQTFQPEAAVGLVLR